MLKKFFAGLLALLAAAVFAATDVNKADQAELETVKGIGPALSQRLLDERKKSAFKDWPDVIERVKGIGSGNAARFSANGLTVNGSAYAGAPATTAKTSLARPDKTAASRPGASASAGAPATAASDKPPRKAAGAASMPRAALPAASSAAPAAKPGVKP